MMSERARSRMDEIKAKLAADRAAQDAKFAAQQEQDKKDVEKLMTELREKS